MAIQVKITGLKEVTNFMNQLPKSINNEVKKKGIMELAKNLQMRIRRRYTMAGYGKGKFSTGYGWKSIKFRPTENGAVVEILASYLALLERGVSSHWVSMDTIEAHRDSPGSTVGKRAPKGFAFSRPPVWWHWKGPFVEPAMNTFRPEIPKILDRFIKDAIKKARKGG